MAILLLSRRKLSTGIIQKVVLNANNNNQAEEATLRVRRVVSRVPQGSGITNRVFDGPFNLDWVSVKNACNQIICEAGLDGTVEIHLTTSMPDDVIANVQGSDEEGYDLTLTALHNCTKFQVLWSVAHELTHIVSQTNEHPVDHTEQQRELFNKLVLALDQGELQMGGAICQD